MRQTHRKEDSRITLERGSWYAAEFISEHGNPDSRHFTPMRVEKLKPKKDGSRAFTLSFYHANYSEGVRNKTYELRTIERAESFIFAERLDSNAKTFVLILPISTAWLNKHFGAGLLADESPETWLEQNCGGQPDCIEIDNRRN